jgi:hypothetical protein
MYLLFHSKALFLGFCFGFDLALVLALVWFWFLFWNWKSYYFGFGFGFRITGNLFGMSICLLVCFVGLIVF